MKKLLRMALILLSTLNYFFVNAQNSNITINGRVTSFEESLALEGVSINVKGTTKSSGTQADGTFSISVSPGDKVLVFKLEGYQPEEVAISQHKTIDVVLKRNGNANDAYIPRYSPTDIFTSTATLKEENILSDHHFYNLFEFCFTR